ncbi:anti-sigma factor family protein [Ectobacillus panaciterrae]|uniref:anti-sigma factor family protein n=1 Tax=Ectobacillus panaciterrae TaxID=363872 RepID=UPI00040C0767|nr:zf-HC2 domain-containing protein [Ectobacillus panaciterrae]
MKCQDIGFIQAYLDGELNRDERKKFIQHLDQCKECQEMLAEASKLNQWEKVTLDDEFTGFSQELPINVEKAWQTFEQNLQKETMQETNSKESEKKGRWHNMKKSSKRWIAATAAAAVVSISLTVPQVRAGANDFLSIFRVNDVQFVKLTESDLQDIQGWISQLNEGEKEIKGIGKVNIKDNENNKPAHFPSEQQAKEAGYEVPKAPNGYHVANVDVRPSFTIQFEIDTEKANKLLKQLQSKAQFENALNGKPFSIMFPKSVATFYNVTGEENQTSISFSYNVTKAPEISVPADVNMDKLRETVLELPILPENVKTQLAGIQDWKRTLPIPYIGTKNAKASETTVQGVKAFAYDTDHELILIWKKDDKVHIMEGYQNAGKHVNLDDFIKLANELK